MLKAMDYKIINNYADFELHTLAGNSVFVVRGDIVFDEEKVIRIGPNSILRFDGGSLGNCIIDAEDCHIEAPLVKVFDNVTFQGDFLNGQVFEIEWFVGQYESSYILESTKDASDEINAAFSCGATTIRFNNCRYYPITKAINVIGTIDIIGHTRYCDSPSWSFRQPCIYNTKGSNIITLFEYTYCNYANKDKIRVNIEGLNFFCTTETTPPDKEDKDLDNEKDRDFEPVVKFKHAREVNGTVVNSNPYTLWGLYINININATHNGANHVSFMNGLEVVASNASITFVEVRGYISTVYNAYIFRKDGECFITDTKIFGNTYCVRGGYFDGGYPVRNYGSHQPIHYLKKHNQLAYFNAVQFENYGYVWDIYCLNDTKYTCRYLAKPTNKAFVFDGSQKKYSPFTIEMPSDFIYPNLLADNTVKYGSTFGTDPEFSINTQTTIICKDENDKEIVYPGKTVEEQLDFKRYRFPKRITRWDSPYLFASRRSDIGYSWKGVPEYKYEYKVEIIIKRTNNVGWYQDRPPLYICPSDPRQDFKIIVSYYFNSEKNGDVTKKEFEFTRSDANPYDYGKYIKIADVFYRVPQEQLSSVLFTHISYSQKITGLRLIPRPMFYIPNYHATDIVRGGTEPVSLTPYDRGENYYHENYGMLTWDGTSWREQDNAKVGVKRNGTFEECPSAGDIYVGFRYFCTGNVVVNGVTKSNIPIFFTGSWWVDSDGNKITSL